MPQKRHVFLFSMLTQSYHALLFVSLYRNFQPVKTSSSERKYAPFCQKSLKVQPFFTRRLCDSIVFASQYLRYRSVKALRSQRDSIGIAMRKLCYRKTKFITLSPHHHQKQHNFLIIRQNQKHADFSRFSGKIPRKLRKLPKLKTICLFISEQTETRIEEITPFATLQTGEEYRCHANVYHQQLLPLIRILIEEE